MAISGRTTGWLSSGTLIFVSCGLLPLQAGAQQTIAVTSAAELAVALKDAAPGTILDLAGSEYGKLALRGPLGTRSSPILIRSADSGNPARFATMDLRDVEYLTLEGLVFDYTFQTKDKANYRPFQIYGGNGITIRDNVFDGDMAEDVSPEDDGFPSGFGLGITGTAGILLQGNNIHDFYRGVVVHSSQNVTLRGNDVHSIRMDGLNFAEVSKVLIEGNHIHDFDRVVDSSDHADMIQFWTNGTAKPSTDIVIRDNILNSSHGAYTQSIFMRNDQVDRGLAGPEMFYRNVTIEDNVIINAHLHGITVGETAGLSIRNNSVLRNAASQGKDDNPALWTPQIRVATASTAVSITRNVTSKISGYDRQADWDVSNNFFVQDTFPGRPGFYDKVFIAARSGDPRKLSSFAYLPGGPLDGAGIGAPQLRQPVDVIATDGVGEAVIRVISDPVYANRFRFDASASGLPAGVSADKVSFVWELEGGTTAEGPVIDHTFTKSGPIRIVLTLSLPDGTRVSTSADVTVPGPDVLLYSSEEGVFTSFARREAVTIPNLEMTRSPLILGQGTAPVIIRPEMIAPFFEAKDFELRLRLRAVGGQEAAGELLRIHQTLVVSVTERGNLDVRFNTEKATQLRLEAGPVDFFSGIWQDIKLSYSVKTGRFVVEVNDKILRAGHTAGSLRQMEHWGLSLGNPFENRKSFDGEMESLSLRVNQYTSAPAN